MFYGDVLKRSDNADPKTLALIGKASVYLLNTRDSVTPSNIVKTLWSWEQQACSAADIALFEAARRLIMNKMQ
ncbi:hypothetical protein [Metakosakonia massiliensis]|uniref:hypothetical protein n=1 Tax=Phytobacter massiliensis TaxID=1485952 RepID=UPI0005C6E4FC|nr:hypothetical protein [Phytobacter massiliensis]